MGLCDLCKTIPFDQLPQFPVYYCGYTKPWNGLVVYHNSQTESLESLGLAHQPNLEALNTAAADCGLCSLIAEAVSRTIQALSEAQEDKLYTYHKLGEYPPDFRLFLTKRRDDGDGFLVLSAGSPRRVYLLTGVGFCVQGDDEPLSSVIRGRVVTEDPSSEETSIQMLRWVENCNVEHAKCNVSNVPLPLRVLDVEYDQIPNRIRLCETGGVFGKYVTLSHVWGNSKHFTTTKSAIAARKEIQLNELPKTFKDAVLITRKLGIRYLWIDSLCICQDDGAEWERESANMAAIYANSYLTIAATGSLGDSIGCLAPRPSRRYATMDFTSKDGITGQVHAFLLRLGDSTDPSICCNLGDQPLTQRGWALQERFLTPRTLHFGRDQMYFECHAHFLSEDGFQVKGRLCSADESSHPSQIQTDGLGSPVMMHRDYRGPWLWYQLLHSYCNRKLTKDSDKLPALSGLARHFAEHIGDQYVAGLWRSTLIEGLIWQAIGRANTAPAEYRAPSWSWASIDGSFGNPGLGGGESPYGDGKKEKWIDLAAIIDCQVVPKGHNPYGEIESGWIQIEAPVEQLIPSEEKELDWESVPHTPTLRMKTGKGDPFGSYCMFDTMDDETALNIPLFALVLVRSDGMAPVIFQALIITPTGEQNNTFRRVGKIVMEEKVLENCDSVKEGANLSIITLV